jgi:formate dehydrogenase subunit gamma
MLRFFCLISLIFLTGTWVFAEDEPNLNKDTRAATGGAQTLEDILARQRGEEVNYEFRQNALGNKDASPITTIPLGTIGLVSDAEVFRQLRYNEASINVSSKSAASEILVQDSGMSWLTLREGPLQNYGGLSLIGMIGLLAFFYLLRGRIPVEEGLAGITIERFKPVERFAHWLLASSFILLGLTGLLTLFGRNFLIPLIGHETFSIFALGSKWIHNNVSWAFMASLIVIFIFWVVHNIPTRLDIKWILQGGGIFSAKSHPSAKKFNAGQKIIFWVVIILGTSVSFSGLSLLFPFEFPMFAATFSKLNSLGIPTLLGIDTLPTNLLPHEEMQLSQVWHTIVAFVMMAVIIAHIYIGSVGMVGAYDAMGSGQVDINWAKQHHDIWEEEVSNQTTKNKIKASESITPAE